MANLIKNQILKHLSKFAKNLSHDQINVSTLKGEGELKNLELNEEVLTDLLELPCWMRLSRATCNRVSLRIPWTKLKSVPIQLALDEVHVEVETCENLREKTGNGLQALKEGKSSSHAYGFADKVVDGISVTANSVVFTLRSKVFTASIQLSRIVVESKSPTWGKGDLRLTRIKDTDKGEVLNFKEISWQTVRIEAKSTTNEDLTPLRLITNQAKCRITIKKKLSDCAVLGCRLVLILDDLLWVLTDDQLKAALHFADSLGGLLKRATAEMQKIKGARKLESLSESNRKQLSKDAKKKQQQAAAAASKSESSCAAAKVFSRYDVVETSYHFYSDRIDLHLCDDPGGKGRSCHPSLSEGGAFQISLQRLQFDCYPYHLASGNRSAWIRYTEGSHSSWMAQALSSFQNQLLDALTSGAQQSHSPLTRSQRPQHGQAQPLQVAGLRPSNDESMRIRESISSQFRKLLTANLIVRLSNFSMWKVSTTKHKSNNMKEFISGDREKFSLPEEMPLIHFEYTQFYYPGDLDFPLPPPKFFAYINPIQLSVDVFTVLWLNAFSLNLQKSVKALSIEQGEPPYLDVKIEAIMFRILVDAGPEAPTNQKDRPQSLHLQCSRILASNIRSLETGSKADLAGILNQFQNSELYFGTQFPNYPNDIPTVNQKFVEHATGISSSSSQQPPPPKLTSPHKLEDIWKVMRKDLLWTESKDIWYLYLEPVWADFHGTPSAPNGRPIPLLDSVPLTLWLYKQPEQQTNESEQTKSTLVKEAKMHVIGQVGGLVSVQLNHFQLLFLLRTVEMLSEITTFLNQDVRHILGDGKDEEDSPPEDLSSVAIGVIAPQIDLSLIMPSISQNRDSIGGDFDSTFQHGGGGRSGGESGLETSVYTIGDLKKDRTLEDEDEITEDDAATTVPSQSDVFAENVSTPTSPERDNTLSVSSSRATPTMTAASSPGVASSVPVHGNVLLNGLLAPANGGASSPGTPNKHPQSGTSSRHSSVNQQYLRASPSIAKRNNSLTSSLTNMMASLGGAAAAAGSSSSGVTSPIEENDDVSIRSGDSSDSDNFVILGRVEANSEQNSLEATLFDMNNKRAVSPVVEMALEVTEESAMLNRSRSPNVVPKDPKIIPSELPSEIVYPGGRSRTGVISVATFHVGRLELAQQSIGSHSCIKLQAASLSGEECPAISWEEFQDKFSSRSKGWSECNASLGNSNWVFRLRLSTKAPTSEDILQHATLEMSSMSLREKISRSTDALVELRAQNLPLQFFTSTLQGIGELFEDEVIPSAIPMKIKLDNIALHLIDDKPSANITSPGSLPVDVSIPALIITREKSGLFTISPTDVSDSTKKNSVAHPSIPEVIKNPSAETGGGPKSLIVGGGVPKVGGEGESNIHNGGTMSYHLDLVRSGVASIETELQQRASLLAVDNQNLRSLLDAAQADTKALKQKVTEAEAWREKAKKAEEAKKALEDENMSLKQTLNYLQQELVKAGTKKK